ncbi:MAG: sugar phosphate nucleotidyltransferase [Desulfitobacterium hafniense]|nr:sugar phosphate nucleotidyltransferase [Desulfitobacterium hafniense]
MQAIILAGGRGKRLDPYTRVLPKPLIPIGEEPIAEILVGQLRSAGADDIVMCLGYLADLIKAYFQDGAWHGVPIRYVTETSPLGTAGPLKNIEGLADNFLVINGDEFTTLNFETLYRHHLSMGADMTIAVQKKSQSSSLGVLEIKDGYVIAYREKPVMDYWVSMGIYVLNKRAVELIPDNEAFDIPDLVQILLHQNARIVSFESQDLWFDIGTMEDLDRARKAKLTTNE